MINSDTPEGEVPDVAEYFLEYTFIIQNTGSRLGSTNEMIQLEFQPDDELEILLGKDIFQRNPNNGMQGPAYLKRGDEGEFILVFGLDRAIFNKLDKDSLEEMLQGTLIVKEGSRKIQKLPVTSK
jgi:hypothetical protein